MKRGTYVEIIILSGYLGSGKTTLLLNLLGQEKRNHRKAAVVMNEFGQQSIDSGIIGNDVPMEDVVNGCICCSSKGQLETAILSLFQNEKPDVVYIEASGVAHPFEIFDTCMSPIIADQIKICSIVTVVDATLWLNRKHLSLRIQKLLHEQVEHSDVIVINKTLFLTDQEVVLLEADFTLYQKKSQIFWTNFSNIALENIHFVRNHMNNNHTVLNVHKDLQIQAYTHTFQQPISKTIFEIWLSSLPKTVHRIKGFVRFKEENNTMVLLQYTYRTPMYYSVIPDYPMNIVIIGEQLDKDAISEELDKIALFSSSLINY